MADCEQCAVLQRQNDFLANDRDGYVQLLTNENNKLRAEVERLKRSRDRYRMAWEDERRRFTEARAAITQETSDE